MREIFHETRCGKIYYRISKDIRADKPFIVFLPGLTADHRLFDCQIEYFKPAYNVLVWDAPGHNRSRPFTFDFNLFDKAAWLMDILNANAITNPIIVGQSMGGYVAQAFMEKYPDTCKGFISIDSAPLQRQYVSRVETFLLKHTRPIYKLYPWKALIRAGSNGVATTPYGRNLMHDMMMTYNDCPDYYITLTAHGYKMLADAIDTDLPYQISCPTLLICGQKDRAGSAARYNREWHKRSGIPIMWIPNAGHNSNTDAPDTVNQLIENFIANLPQ